MQLPSIFEDLKNSVTFRTKDVFTCRIRRNKPLLKGDKLQTGANFFLLLTSLLPARNLFGYCRRKPVSVG